MSSVNSGSRIAIVYRKTYKEDFPFMDIIDRGKFYTMIDILNLPISEDFTYDHMFRILSPTVLIPKHYKAGFIRNEFIALRPIFDKAIRDKLMKKLVLYYLDRVAQRKTLGEIPKLTTTREIISRVALSSHPENTDVNITCANLLNAMQAQDLYEFMIILVDFKTTVARYRGTIKMADFWKEEYEHLKTYLSGSCKI